ncbi:MAG TPA: adenylyl-sulfate kinase [Saprospiraceae bacterium]|nr:adenylyl-sulfate kinase [Saprospiraceae bacterium]
MTNQEHIHPIFDTLLTRQNQEKLLGQKGIVLWFTGLSGSGKSTIARALEKHLYEQGKLVKVLDGDNIRMGLNNNLSFSVEDRKENIRRIAEVAKLFLDTGIITICSFISPTEESRAIARNIIGDQDFKLIYINTPLEECEKRDVKGLYKKARNGEIKGFTGIDDPFEAPKNPDLELNTTSTVIEDNIEKLMSLFPDIKTEEEVHV